MDDKEFYEYLKDRDAMTREERVKRRDELRPVTYRRQLPELLWDYLTEAVQYYVDGHFTGVVIWCATILELVLADRLICQGKGAKEMVELITFAEKTRLCAEFGIITKLDKKNIDAVRNLRNAIAHGNAGTLGKMAKAYYGDISDSSSWASSSFFINNFGDGIKGQALEFLDFTRDLTERWYGEKAV